jgi:hypothetical protein
MAENYWNTRLNEAPPFLMFNDPLEAAMSLHTVTPTLTAAQSARGVVDVMIGLDAGKSGRLFSHTGVDIPW